MNSVHDYGEMAWGNKRILVIENAATPQGM
jgi:hypothetical protein